MKYQRVVSARFCNRPNRFIAQVEVDGILETVHVKNTGRCKELLVPGCTVYLSASENPMRKTKYDLIADFTCNFKQSSIGIVTVGAQAQEVDF